MVEYSSTFTVESEKCPGVSFTLQRISVRRRGRLDEILAPVEAKLLPLRREAAALAKERGAEGVATDREIELRREIARIDREELTPAAVAHVLQRIDGLTIDGAAATLELLAERGPDELYQEIAWAVARELRLLPEERENLSSLSTSAGAVDGGKRPGSASPAGPPATITDEGARSSTVPGSATATDIARVP